MTTTNTAQISDRAFAVNRTIRAPAAKIFAAYTHRDQVEQWWAPKGGSLRVESMDVRTGGRYRFLQRTPEGHTMAFIGSYLEVKPPTRLVYTFQVEGQPGSPVTTTVELAEAAGATTLTLTLEFASKQEHDVAVQYGAVAGAKAALGQLAAFLGGA